MIDEVRYNYNNGDQVIVTGCTLGIEGMEKTVGEIHTVRRYTRTAKRAWYTLDGIPYVYQEKWLAPADSAKINISEDDYNNIYYKE